MPPSPFYAVLLLLTQKKYAHVLLHVLRGEEVMEKWAWRGELPDPIQSTQFHFTGI